MQPGATFTSRLSPCHYLPDRLAQLRYELMPHMTGEGYMHRLREGWRRFGPIVFRPDCPSCRMCQSVRVPVRSFAPTRSQRRVWKRNERDVTIRVGSPSASAEKLELFARFHAHGHATKGWPDQTDADLDVFLANPFPTEEWTYHLGDRLIGVGYVDALPEGLSAIYFYWDPAEARRSLGTLNILAMLASARDRDVPYVYLGYYVAGCRSMEYKGHFRPSEILSVGGVWEPYGVHAASSDT